MKSSVVCCKADGSVTRKLETNFVATRDADADYGRRLNDPSKDVVKGVRTAEQISGASMLRDPV